MSIPTQEQIDTICRDLSKPMFPNGDLAALRRLSACDTDSLVLWRCLTMWKIEPPADDEIQAWTDAIALLASGHAVHSKATHLGAALHAANVSEGRLQRLLRAEGDAYADHARAMLHLMVTKGKSGDLTHLIQLRFNLDDAQRERVRRHIASNFYRAETQE